MKNYIAVLFGGVLAGSVFAYVFPGLLMPLFVLPLLLALSKAVQPGDYKENALYLLLFFIPLNAMVLSWFLDSYIDHLGITQSATLGLTSFSLVLMTLVMTACMLPLAYLARYIYRGAEHLILKAVLLLPSVWVLSEWLRSVVFSAFLYGPGASIGDYWNFGSMGLGLMNTPLAYGSRLVGMYGLTFLIVALVSSACLAIIYKKYLPIIISGSVLLLVTSLGSHIYTASADAKSQTYHGSVFQQHERYSYQETLPYISPATKTPKDLIILPEYSDVFERGSEAISTAYVDSRLASNGLSITVSEGRQQKRYGTLEIRDNNGKIVDTQTKKLLIPTGEYMPFVLKNILIVTHKTSVLDAFKRVKKVEVGTGSRVYKQPNGDIYIGPVACSGILGRNIYRNLAQNGAGVFTNSASLVVFNRSSVYFNQSIQMAKFHAIANSRPYIQASKGAAAFVLNNDGKYIVAPDDSGSRFIDFNFSSNYRKTAYTIVGEWVLWLSAALCFGAFALVGVKLFFAKPQILRRYFK